MNNQDNTNLKEEKSNRQLYGIFKQIKILAKPLIFISLFSIIIILVGFLLTQQLFGNREKNAQILTTSTLEKIINISDLSTFQASYNGIAEVMDKNKLDKLKYYVSYEAKVNAGFNAENVKITSNEKTKTITVTIPKIVITDVNVDIASLDYIFQDDKADTNTVSSEAYEICIEDARKESEEETKIYDLAEQNAKNIMQALVSPFIEQLDSDYKLEIINGGV